jgi:glycerol-3-phosphate dehydrogenase (NAD(P)+)
VGKAPNGIRAAIVGSGNWATAFSKVLIDAGTDCTLFGVESAVIEQIQTTHTHPNFPGVHISRRLKATTNPEVLREAELIVLAIPAQAARCALGSWGAFFAPGVKVCSLIKGIEVASLKPISEVIQEVSALARSQIAVLSGPNLAGEIILRQPAAAVVASESLETAYLVAKACDSGYFKPFVSRDVTGVELCGDLKNVIAICAGMCKGLEMGYNTLSSLIARGLKEISELGAKMGAQIETFQGLAGVEI